jgi:Fe-S-cluster containining protein
MTVSPCQSCGACCATSAEWPRFSLESEEALALIPPQYVDDANGRMRCEGNRCSALNGKVGEATACVVYAVRPEVCRTCEPGDPECDVARRQHGLAPISLDAA